MLSGVADQNHFELLAFPPCFHTLDLLGFVLLSFVMVLLQGLPRRRSRVEVAPRTAAVHSLLALLALPLLLQASLVLPLRQWLTR